jgi:hypothetical protein
LAKRLIHIVVSVWLAILLLFGTTPKEFLHSFAQHKDTQHTTHHSGFVLEEKHTHCAFVAFELTPFSNDYTFPFISLSIPSYNSTNTILDATLIQQCIIHTSLRGPPAAHSIFLI